MVTFARFSFTLVMRKWIEHQQRDETITINRHRVTSKAVVTKTTPAPWCLLSFQCRVASHFVFPSPWAHTHSETWALKTCPSEFLFEEIFGEETRDWRNSESPWRKLSKEMGMLGLGSEKDDLILCSCLIRSTCSLKSRSWLQRTPKAYFFFMFKAESVIFSPSFQTCSLASNLPNASLSYSLF